MRFQVNPRFTKEAEQENQRVMLDYAARAEANTRAIGQAIRYTGAYAASIRRTGTTVYSTDPAARIIEYGSVNNPAFAPLRRGADMTGARLRS